MAAAGAAGGSAAASSHAIRLEITSKTMAKVVMEIVNSCHFHLEEIRAQIREEQLTLSQAFCLLWQNADSGDVDGRKAGIETNGGAAAAVLIDLVVLGKVEIQVEPNKTLGVKNDTIRLKVINDNPTDTYLDGAIFNEILKHHKKNPDKPDKVKSWIYHGIGHLQSRNLCSTHTLDSLVEIGILDMKEKFIGRRYPTLKPGLEENLEKQIRAVALDNAEPSSFIWVLLALARSSDNLFVLQDPVLEKHFSKEEYSKAKERLNVLVGIDKGKEEKYQAVN